MGVGVVLLEVGAGVEVLVDKDRTGLEEQYDLLLKETEALLAL